MVPFSAGDARLWVSRPGDFGVSHSLCGMQSSRRAERRFPDPVSSTLPAPILRNRLPNNGLRVLNVAGSDDKVRWSFPAGCRSYKLSPTQIARSTRRESVDVDIRRRKKAGRTPDYFRGPTGWRSGCEFRKFRSRACNGGRRAAGVRSIAACCALTALAKSPVSAKAAASSERTAASR